MQLIVIEQDRELLRTAGEAGVRATAAAADTEVTGRSDLSSLSDGARGA